MRVKSQVEVPNVMAAKATDADLIGHLTGPSRWEKAGRVASDSRSSGKIFASGNQKHSSVMH